MPWYSGGLSIQEWECEGLGVPCGVTRLSLAITWPIAALCAAVCVGETAYVLNRHGRGVWHHTLPFLQAVPPEDLVDARIYTPLAEADPEPKIPMYGLPLFRSEQGKSWDTYRAALFGAREPEGARKPLRPTRRTPPE